MIINTLQGCCSIIIMEDLYSITQEQFEEELINYLIENYDNLSTQNEHPTCIIATTNNNEQPVAIRFLKENKFKEIPFYGRHQNNFIELTGKRQKYTSLWIRTSLPKGIITKAKRKQRDYRLY